MLSHEVLWAHVVYQELQVYAATVLLRQKATLLCNLTVQVEKTLIGTFEQRMYHDPVGTLVT